MDSLVSILAFCSTIHNQRRFWLTTKQKQISILLFLNLQIPDRLHKRTAIFIRKVAL